MKFSCLYSNRDGVFPPIRFETGFNVIFAQVKDPTVKEQDSHNLGKTFLIQVLDFALLSSIDGRHPFKQHSDIFEDFVFYLEVETISGKFVTIKRPVAGRSVICLHVSLTPNRDLRDQLDSTWTYLNLSLEKARVQLNEFLDLEAITPYPYRKGLGYFLREQSDYDEIFRISNFQYGPDKNWKPFVALMLGFNHAVTLRKYEIDDRIKNLENALKLVEEEAGSKSDKYDEIRGLIEIRSSTIAKMRSEIDAFSFRDLESTINETAVNSIEAEIADLNEHRYKLDYELQEIDRSLNSEIKFDIDKIEEIFSETGIVFPQALVRSYEELLDFNRQLSSGRTARLKTLRQKLIIQRQIITDRIQDLDRRRQAAFEVLKQQETFEKYRVLQRTLAGYEQELYQLQQQLVQLNQAANLQKEIEDKNQEATEAINEIRKSVRGVNEIYTAIRTTFSTYVERVLNVQALLSVIINQSGNLEFNVRTLDRDVSGRETSEAQGTSYKKILAACFDLALLKVYSTNKFYRFVYHDGIFEGLDNRKKVSLMELIREVCVNNNIQHILTVIDSDLPRDERDQKLLFTDNEIVRYLHDQGSDGRLFRTRAF